MNTQTISALGRQFTRDSLEALTGSACVTLYNELQQELARRLGQDRQPVNKFRDLEQAHKRCWASLLALEDLVRESAVVEAPAVPKAEKAPKPSAPKAEKDPKPVPVPKAASQRGRKGTFITPVGGPLKSCRAGTKQALLVDALAEPLGKTMDELLALTSGGRCPWQKATVRSAFSWDLVNHGYGVKSEIGADGVERFHLLYPDGATAPVPHRTTK